MSELRIERLCSNMTPECSESGSCIVEEQQQDIRISLANLATTLDGTTAAEGTKSSEKSRRQRLVLTKEQAVEIFRLKGIHGFPTSHSASSHLATKYKVSSKSIRDIWNGRSWLDATYELWSDNCRPKRRIVGRPKGKKDSRPRQLRSRGASKPPHTAISATYQDHPNQAQASMCDSNAYMPEQGGGFEPFDLLRTFIASPFAQAAYDRLHPYTVQFEMLKSQQQLQSIRRMSLVPSATTGIVDTSSMFNAGLNSSISPSLAYINSMQNKTVTLGDIPEVRAMLRF